MPKRTNQLESYFATRDNGAVGTDLRTFIEAWRVGNELQPSDELVMRFVAGWRNRSVEWRLQYTTCDELFREHPSLEGRQPIFQMSPGNCFGAFRVLWTEADRATLQSALACENRVCWHRMRDTDGKWRNYGGLYLFGQRLWELKESDKRLNEEELRLLFLETLDRDREKFERLRRKFSGVAGSKLTDRREAISEEVRIFVWRRDSGQCVRCGSQERLEFDHVIPVSKGGSNTERNIQLLCEVCNRKKGDSL